MERIRKLLDLLNDSPNDSFLQHALALEYIKIGNDTSAKNLFISVLEYDPGYVGSYYHLGKLFERNGDYKAAMIWYKKGMAAAKANCDNKAFHELQLAYEEIAEDE